jgi:phasin family protein
VLHAAWGAMLSLKGTVKMSNVVEQIQKATKDQGDAAISSATTLTTSIQTIATAHADYAKKAMQDGSEFISKLTSLKEPAQAMELQSEYVKNAYETFVAEAKKISELYTDFFKQTAKPLEALIAKNKAA